MYVEARRRLVAWLRRQLIGPDAGNSLTMSPLDRYPTGVLHPVDPGLSGIDPASAGAEKRPSHPSSMIADDEPGCGRRDGRADRDARPARQAPIRAAVFGGILLLRSGGRAALDCGFRGRVRRHGGAGRGGPVRGSRVHPDPASGTWCRRGRATAARKRLRIDSFWEGRAGVDVRARPHGDGLILTVTLCNRGGAGPQCASPPADPGSGEASPCSRRGSSA